MILSTIQKGFVILEKESNMASLLLKFSNIYIVVGVGGNDPFPDIDLPVHS